MPRTELPFHVLSGTVGENRALPPQGPHTPSPRFLDLTGIHQRRHVVFVMDLSKRSDEGPIPPEPPAGPLKVNRSSPAAKYNAKILRSIARRLHENPEYDIARVLPSSYAQDRERLSKTSTIHSPRSMKISSLIDVFRPPHAEGWQHPDSQRYAVSVARSG